MSHGRTSVGRDGQRLGSTAVRALIGAGALLALTAGASALRRRRSTDALAAPPEDLRRDAIAEAHPEADAHAGAGSDAGGGAPPPADAPPAHSRFLPAILAVCGLAMIGVAIAGQQQAPMLDRAAAATTREQAGVVAEEAPADPANGDDRWTPAAAADAGASGVSARRAQPPASSSADAVRDADHPAGAGAPGAGAPASPPVSLSVPSIGIESAPVVRLGLLDDGSMEVPADGADVGWYRHGPTPGEVGPAVLVGHIDSIADGPAVFFRLAELRPGDPVHVARADGRLAVYTVQRLEQHPKADFPTTAVFGDTAAPTLRLVTCGGSFDEATGHYRDNVVAYATLLEVRPAATGPGAHTRTPSGMVPGA